MERSRVIIISRIKEISKLYLNLEEIEDYYNSNNSIFYRFTSPSKLASIEDINIVYNTIL